jgi:GAF domain-containing protein
MNEDQLNRTLEDLFSDVSLPEPEGSGDLDRQREEPGEAPPPVESRLDDRERAPLRPPSEEAPAAAPSGPAEPDASLSGLSPLDTVSALADRERLREPSEVASWRQQLLQASLYAALVIGLVVVGLGAYRLYAGGQRAHPASTIVLSLYVAVYLLLLLITFWKQIPYRARAASFLGSVYGLGLLDLVQFGPDGDGRVFFLTLPVLAALLLGKLGGGVALLISFLTQALFRVLPVDGLIGDGAGSPLVLLLLGAGLILVQDRSMVYLSRALDRCRKLAADLASSNARVETHRRELKQRDLQLDLVMEVAKIAASRLDVNGVLHRAVELVPDYLNCYLASIFLLDEGGRPGHESMTLRAATGAIGAELEAEGLRLEVGETSIVGWAARHRKPYVAPEVSVDDLYRPHPVLGGTMSEAAVPLKADGFLLGVLDVQSGSRDALGEIDVRVLRGVADQLAMVVQNARQGSDEAARLEATSPLYRTNRRLSGATTVDEVVQVIVDAVAEAEADGCLIGLFEGPSAPGTSRFRSYSSSSGAPVSSRYLRYLGGWDQPTDRSHSEASDHSQRHELRPGVALPLSENPLPMALMQQFWSAADVAHGEGPSLSLRGRAREREEAPRDQLSDEVRVALEMIDAGACVNVPLQAGDEHVGHMLVLRRKPGSFTESSLRFLDVLGGQAAVALVRAWRFDEARRRARREELVSKATARMHESLDLESVLSTAVRDIGETLGLAALEARLGRNEGS